MTRKLVAFAACLAAGLAVSGASAAPAPVPPPPPAPTELLAARLLAPTPALDDLRELTDSIGGRPTGSPAFDQAIDWAQAKFLAAGMDAVRVESYVPPRNWLPRGETAEIVSPRYAKQPPERNQLRTAAMPFSPPTPAAGLEAEVYEVGEMDLAAVTGAAASAKIRGKWLLVRSDPMHSVVDLLSEYLATPPMFTAAAKAGAIGVLWMGDRPGRLLYRHCITFDGSLAAIPGVVIEREGAQYISRMLHDGKPVRVRATVAIDVQDKPTDRNVVAEIRGREKADEVVVLGAHLDSWDLGRGALDNGCNAVMPIDIARAMATLARVGIRPRRTVRFILYSGEELGLYGSWFDARAHRADLDKLTAVIVFDIGTGRTLGFSLGGRADIADGVARALAPVAALGPFTQSTDAFIGTDNYDYMVEGVPTLVANQDPVPYLPDYHAESDTFDKVDARELAANSVIAATLAWNLADDSQRLGKRQTHAEVAALAKATGLDAQMKAYGIWDDFVAGRRGRAVR